MVAILSELATGEGLRPTMVDGVKLGSADRGYPRAPVLYEPSIYIVASGRKTGYLGDRTFVYDPNNYLVLSVPLPFECQTEARAGGADARHLRPRRAQRGERPRRPHAVATARDIGGGHRLRRGDAARPGDERCRAAAGRVPALADRRRDPRPRHRPRDCLSRAVRSAGTPAARDGRPPGAGRADQRRAALDPFALRRAIQRGAHGRAKSA